MHLGERPSGERLGRAGGHGETLLLRGILSDGLAELEKRRNNMWSGGR